MRKPKQNIISTVEKEPKDFEQEEPVVQKPRKGKKAAAEPLTGKLAFLKDERFFKNQRPVFSVACRVYGLCVRFICI